MALKQYKPTTPGRRGLVLVNRSELHKGKPVKTLTSGLNKKGGRNNHGRITARRRGGGAKRSYRLVDFKRRRFEAAVVERLEYDPNRSAFIALIKYPNGDLSYILAPQRLAPGDSVVAGERVDVKPGNAMPLSSMPIGTIIHNVEMKRGRGGQIDLLLGGDGVGPCLGGVDGEGEARRTEVGHRGLVACIGSFVEITQATPQIDFP